MVANYSRLSKNKNNQYAGNMQIAVGNRGRHTVSNFYWHLFIPKEIKVNFVARTHAPAEEVFGDWRKFSNREESPVFPNRSFTFGELNVNDAESNTFPMYSFFSTEHGTDPANFHVEMNVEESRRVESRS